MDNRDSHTFKILLEQSVLPFFRSSARLSKMSSSLIWEIIRNNNSFLVKRNGFQFNRERNNLTNKNSFKYSGLANAKAVGISTDAKKGLVLTKKSRSQSRKPSKATPSMSLKGTTRQNAKVISAETAGKHYRPGSSSQPLQIRLQPSHSSGGYTPRETLPATHQFSQHILQTIGFIDYHPYTSFFPRGLNSAFA